MSERLVSALSKMLPEAKICVVSERPWYSATFAGVQMSLDVKLSGANRAARADHFARVLTTHEFELPKHIIADIVVARQVIEEHELRLIIDALMLES